MPIVKKGHGERVEDYRGVTIMPTLYKIYASVLAERLKEDVENKGILPPNQTGFRKGMGTIDNIFVLNFLVNRQIKKRDDVVLLAENKGSMKSMIERLEGYLDRKGLTLNTGKTKILRFREWKGRISIMNWRWKEKKIEQVKEMKYLGYTQQRNGGQEAQVRERVRKAAAIMGQIWGIGKRRFGKNWKRRIGLFDKLVWTVASYGVEI
ncbi:uncharacterized protein [Temnothorax nylanderi]|uniref:uncharacterized protein n=1 Tax=Temnothorax nylanderi TaxID=102681 RepID=UPI003A841A39